VESGYRKLLSPADCALALIDFQPAMYQGPQSHDRKVALDNVQILALASKPFKVPTIVTTLARDTLSGSFMPEITEGAYPEKTVVDRSSINSWLNADSRAAVAATGRKRHRIGGSVDRRLRELPRT
jgi:nicotinamidase-related amidase